MNEGFVITENSRRCKCCLDDVNLRNMWSEYEINGEREVYGEMLNESFGLAWNYTSDQQYICESCINRLRIAYLLKKEILAAQELLIEGISIEPTLKIEVDIDSISPDEVYEQVEYLDDSNVVLEGAATSSHSSTPEPRQTKWPQKKIKSERNKTYKQYAEVELRKAIQVVRNGDMSCTEAAAEYGIPKKTLNFKVNHFDDKEDENKYSSNEKHYQLTEEIKLILEYTNAIPFKTKTTRYYCFYCSTDGPIFEDPDELRSHTRINHVDERSRSLDRFLRPQWMNEIIKLDVEGLYCMQCYTLLPDWNNMFEHFAEIHDLEFNEAYTRIIPYALTSELKCVLCQEGFHNFGHLDSHMNHHYSNYICYMCGDTFLAASRLDKHLKVHKTGIYSCQYCEKVFTLEKYRKKHINLVHNQESAIKCLYCPEKFIGTFQRHVHVTKRHSEKVKTYTCEACGTCFTWKPYFLAHMRRKHGTEKNHQCEYCKKTFLMRYELKSHIVKHTGEKNYVCGLCNERFTRMISLKRHLQLYHET